VRKFDKKPEIQPGVLIQPIKQVKRSRELRKEMSLPEVLLWVQLQKRPGGHRFRKQVPQHPYTLDFACLKARLCIEVDGDAHNRGDQPRRDAVRDRVMVERGFRTLRLPAYDVLKNMEACVMAIVAACDEANPPRNGEVPEGRRGPKLGPAPLFPNLGTPPSAAPPPPRSGEDFR
jgi:very-short-patch-repair endonuclease